MGLEESEVSKATWCGPRGRAESLPAVLATAREALGILHLSFITVVDREGSFELTYELLDFRGAGVRVKTVVEGEEPVVPTVTNVYPTANWHEREAYDMFGVAFRGHPTCGGRTCGRTTSTTTRCSRASRSAPSARSRD